MANKHLAKRKRSLKAMGRRGLSLFLSLVMTLSLVQIGAFATGSDGTDQIGKYFEYDDKGKTTGEKLDSSLKSIEGDSITMQKNITAVDKDTFNINLIVTTKEKLEDIKLSPDAAVVLVLDASYSMIWNGNQQNNNVPLADQRLTKAKTAAQQFVDNFVTDADGAKRMISVVSFCNTATCNIGWTDAAESTAKADEVKSAISGIQAGSSTNIDGGLLLAYNLLGSSQVEDISSRFVVLLTDGSPNYKAIASESTETISGTNGSGWNQLTTKECADAAAATASSIKSDRKAAIYTLAFAAANDTCYTSWEDVTVHCTQQGWHFHGFDLYKGEHDYTEQRQVSVTIGEWLANSVASTGCARNATTGDQVSIGFDEIVKQIKTLLQAWQVTDPMAQYINYEGLVHPVSGRPATNSNVTYDETQKTLTWNLWQEQPTSDGQTPATYT